MIRSRCTDLKFVVTMFSGMIKGQKSENKRWLGKSNSKSVNFLTNTKKSILHNWSINYDESIILQYPSDFEKPRLGQENILSGQKTLFFANTDVGWGRRAKSVIERRGYYPSHSFWILSPLSGVSPNITDEVVAAVLNWYVANSWIAENRNYTWVNRQVLDTIPFPKNLSSYACRAITEAVHQLEAAAISDVPLPAEAQTTIDTILKAAYGLDEATFTKLKAIAEWDNKPQITLDPQPDRSTANYIISGSVDSIQASEGTITLWISGFDDLQTTPIDPIMPGWLLRPDAAFRATIPFLNMRERTLEGIVWGGFAPQQYTYLDEEELVQELSRAFSSDQGRS